VYKYKGFNLNRLNAEPEFESAFTRKSLATSCRAPSRATPVPGEITLMVRALEIMLGNISIHLFWKWEKRKEEGMVCLGL
jgi:hypothetical protein